MTPAQRRALRELWPRYGVRMRYGVRVAPRRWGHGPVVLDIGFGMGDAFAECAARRPEAVFLGIEPHRPGVGNALIRLAELDVDNARVIRGDAISLLSGRLETGSIDEVKVLFPDPWPNQPHRRIVSPAVAGLLARACRPGARWVVGTDVAAYAEHAFEVLETSPHWKNRHPQWSPRPDLPTSRYEQRASAAGTETFFLEYERISAQLPNT